MHNLTSQQDFPPPHPALKKNIHPSGVFSYIPFPRFTDAMEKMIPNGAPSLVGCKKLVVEGEVTFAKDVVWKLRR